MSLLITAAFSEFELLVAEIEGLLDILREDDLPEIARLGAMIRLNMMETGLKNLESMIRQELILIDVDHVLEQVEAGKEIRGGSSLYNS